MSHCYVQVGDIKIPVFPESTIMFKNLIAESNKNLDSKKRSSVLLDRNSALFQAECLAYLSLNYKKKKGSLNMKHESPITPTIFTRSINEMLVQYSSDGKSKKKSKVHQKILLEVVDYVMNIDLRMMRSTSRSGNSSTLGSESRYSKQPQVSLLQEKRMRSLVGPDGFLDSQSLKEILENSYMLQIYFKRLVKESKAIFKDDLTTTQAIKRVRSLLGDKKSANSKKSKIESEMSDELVNSLPASAVGKIGGDLGSLRFSWF